MRIIGCLLASALMLAACQPAGPPPSHAGDQIMPGDVQVEGQLYCEASRIELAAIVLGGPPKPAALEDVADATTPGCTWVAADGPQRVRLNVYDAATLKQLTPAQKFGIVATVQAHAVGQGTEVPDLGVRAARFGFATPDGDGLLLVQTPTRVIEFQTTKVSLAKLLVFSKGVVENVESPP